MTISYTVPVGGAADMGAMVASGGPRAEEGERPRRGRRARRVPWYDAAGMRAHVVRQGDYLDQLADALGFDADAVWSAPENADLARRRDPNLLCPGDVLFVPPTNPPRVAVEAGTANRYVARVPTTRVKLGFEDRSGPLAGERCVIHGLGAPRERTTDGDGWLAIDVPLTARECRVSFPGRRLVFPVLIGHMDPITEASGVRKRLAHLGYYPAMERREIAAVDAADADRLALLAFQLHQGLLGTGVADDATTAALVREHGS